MREELAAALELNRDTPPEPVANEAPIVDEGTEAVTETPTLEALESPSNFSAEQRETFGKLPREAQEIVLARHRDMLEDYTRKTTELANQRKPVDEINAILEPYKQEMELQGVKPAEVVQRLLAAQRFLQADPSKALPWLAQQFNVDLKSLVPQDEAYVDPTVKALRDELNQLKASLQQREATTQQGQVAEAQKIIKEFAEAKTDKGEPKHPHYERLKSVMAPYVAQGKTLDEAYEISSYTLPEVRERIASEAAKAAQAEAVKKAEEDRKKKAKEAQGATQIIRSRGTAAETEGKKLTLREELARNFRDLTEGRI